LLTSLASDPDALVNDADEVRVLERRGAAFLVAQLAVDGVFGGMRAGLDRHRDLAAGGERTQQLAVVKKKKRRIYRSTRQLGKLNNHASKNNKKKRDGKTGPKNHPNKQNKNKTKKKSEPQNQINNSAGVP
jgi:hypothetical protein